LVSSVQVRLVALSQTLHLTETAFLVSGDMKVLQAVPGGELLRSSGKATPEWIRNRVLTISMGDCHMRNEFTAIIERDGGWYIAYCPEISGANGQGHTLEECRENLAEAIALILEDRRQDALRGLPDEAIREVVVVE
jgi:predicted RNase H-like HicB family nuclease